MNNPFDTFVPNIFITGNKHLQETQYLEDKIQNIESFFYFYDIDRGTEKNIKKIMNYFPFHKAAISEKTVIPFLAKLINF